MWAGLRSVKTVWSLLPSAVALVLLLRRPSASASSSPGSPQSSCSRCTCRWTSTWSWPVKVEQQKYKKVSNWWWWWCYNSSWKTHLVALAVVLQAARPFAVAAFAVSAVWLALFAFTDFRFEGLGVPVQTCLWEKKRKNKKPFVPWFINLTRSNSIRTILQLTFIALRRSVSCSKLLKQLLQLQLLQNSPFAKQSQYLRGRKRNSPTVTRYGWQIRLEQSAQAQTPVWLTVWDTATWCSYTVSSVSGSFPPSSCCEQITPLTLKWKAHSTNPWTENNSVPTSSI